MSNAKNKQVLMGVGAFAGVATIALLGLSFMNMTAASEADSARETAEQSWENAYRLDPFPSQENIDKFEDRAKIASENVAALRDSILGNSFALTEDEEATNDTSCKVELEEMVTRLQADAPKDGTMNPIVPAELKFGFDVYVGSDQNVTDDPATIHRLLLQKKMIEAIVREIYSCGVDRLTGVGRVQFEKDVSSESKRASSGGRSGRGRGATTAVKKDDPTAQLYFPLAEAPALNTPEGIDLSVERFKFVFVSRESAVAEFLDRISDMEEYVIVSSLKIEKIDANADVALTPMQIRDANSKGGETATGKEQAELVIPEVPDARRLSGADLEKPVVVTVEIDVVSPRSEDDSGEEDEEEEE